MDLMTAMFDTMMSRMSAGGQPAGQPANPVQATAQALAPGFAPGSAPAQALAPASAPASALALAPTTTSLPGATTQHQLQPQLGNQAPQQLPTGPPQQLPHPPIGQRLLQQSLGTGSQTPQQAVGTPPVQQQQAALAPNQNATPSAPPLGAALTNGPAIQLSQLVQHPPPPLPNPQGTATNSQQPYTATFGHGASTFAPLVAQSGTQQLAGAPNNHTLPHTNINTNSLLPVPLSLPGSHSGHPLRGQRDIRTRGQSGTDSESAASTRSGRSSVRRRAEHRRHGVRDPSTEDESEEFAYNRGLPEIKNCKKIEICLFSPENKELDFAIWVNQFEGAVNRCLNPHSQRRHYQACLIWLPSTLKADAYSIWSRAEHKTTNWLQLKVELETAFEDGSVRTEWKTNLKAYTWDEDNQTLHSYCAKVKNLVDNFEAEMADCPAARKAQYFLRFVNGLPDDYIEYIRLGLPPKCKDVNKARDVCMQFQGVKKLRAKEKNGSGRLCRLSGSHGAIKDYEE